MSKADNIRKLITNDKYLQQTSLNDLLMLVKEYPLHQPLRTLLAKKATMQQHPSAATFMQESCLFTTFPDYLHEQVNNFERLLPHLPEAEAAAKAVMAEQLTQSSVNQGIQQNYETENSISDKAVTEKFDEQEAVINESETNQEGLVFTDEFSVEEAEPSNEVDDHTQPNFEFDADFKENKLDEETTEWQETQAFDEILLVESSKDDKTDLPITLKSDSTLENEAHRPKIYTIEHVSDAVAKDLALLRNQHENEDEQSKNSNHLTENDLHEVVQSDLDLLKQKNETSIDEVTANKAITGYKSLMETVREKLDNINDKPKNKQNSLKTLEKSELTYSDYSNNSFHLSNPTETLASVLARQGNWIEAIDVYNQLMLKYPEKSDYFAGKIEWLKSKLR